MEGSSAEQPLPITVPESPASRSGPFRVTLKLGGGVSSPQPSPSVPQTGFAAPVAETESASRTMDWQPASASSSSTPVAGPSAPHVASSSSTRPVQEGLDVPASATPAATPTPATPVESTSAAPVTETKAPTSQAGEAKPKAPAKKRKKGAADSGAGHGKAWRKGLKGYGDNLPVPVNASQYARDVEIAGIAGPQAKSVPNMKGPFASNQPFEPKLPRPRKWTKSLTALKVISGHTLYLPSWQGAADSEYLTARKKAEKAAVRAQHEARLAAQAALATEQQQQQKSHTASVAAPSPNTSGATSHPHLPTPPAQVSPYLGVPPQTAGSSSTAQ